MKKLSKKAWILFFSLAIVLPTVAFFTMRYYQQNISELPYYAENYAIQNNIPDFKVPAYQFINQDNLTVDNSFTDGKIWVAHYFFTTCPTICPAMISGISDVQEQFKNNSELRIVSFTVDPKTDTPEVLKNYAENRGIDTQQWQLATGDKKLLYRFARKGLFIEATDGDGGANDFIHSEKLVLIDSNNRIRGYYDGTEPSDIKLLINDIQRLLKEKK